MLNKKIIFIFSIILLLSLEPIIKYSLSFYNKKFEINFSIENFKENSILIEDNKPLTYYEMDILKNEYEEYKTILFLHNLFESSLNSKYHLINTLNFQNIQNENLKILLLDLPAHGKSFKQKEYDYSYRNISSSILKLLENLNLENIYLICDKLSSNIGLNMICLNDKIFSDLILIDPSYEYNPKFQNLILNVKNKLLPLKNLYTYFKNKDESSLYDYKTSYFNNKQSSNKYVKRVLKESTPIEIPLSKNINLSFVITNTKSFNSKYLSHLSNNFSEIFFNPKIDLINHIIKK